MGDRAANLQKAIACFEQALRFRTPEADPLDYATTQNNLGVAYAELPVGDRAANLQKAIACFERALRFWTSKADPFNYALTQHNLGYAYATLPRGTVRPTCEGHRLLSGGPPLPHPEADPLDWALTQNNLGNAYRELPAGDRAANLQKAIACYEAALRFHTPRLTPSTGP